MIAVVSKKNAENSFLITPYFHAYYSSTFDIRHSQVAATAFHQDLNNDKWFVALGVDKKLRRIEFR